MYYIIFTDQTKICLRLCFVELFEDVTDYRLASRNSFHDRDEAELYAKKLANDNNLQYIGTVNRDGYLD